MRRGAYESNDANNNDSRAAGFRERVIVVRLFERDIFRRPVRDARYSRVSLKSLANVPKTARRIIGFSIVSVKLL